MEPQGGNEIANCVSVTPSKFQRHRAFKCRGHFMGACTFSILESCIRESLMNTEHSGCRWDEIGSWVKFEISYRNICTVILQPCSQILSKSIAAECKRVASKSCLLLKECDSAIDCKRRGKSWRLWSNRVELRKWIKFSGATRFRLDFHRGWNFVMMLMINKSKV